MYEAKVYRVMTGAPSDIKEEINIVRKYINDWNPVNSENKRIVIFPINWKMDCYPASGIPPQEHINEVLTCKSDMMICIFGTTLGTPTNKEVSGTVEELKAHIANKRPAMVYFRTAVQNINKIQPEQLQKIIEFKEEIKDKTFFREYSTAKEFKNRFKSDFEQAVNTYFVNGVVPELPVKIIQKVKPQMIEKKVHKKASSEKRPSTKLKITFPDGTVINDYYAYRTFVEAIQKIGAERVMELKIKRCRVFLVGKERSDRYSNSQIDVGNGIYVLTHSSTEGKKRDLELIARKLKLKLKIDIIKSEE